MIKILITEPSCFIWCFECYCRLWIAALKLWNSLEGKQWTYCRKLTRRCEKEKTFSWNASTNQISPLWVMQTISLWLPHVMEGIMFWCSSSNFSIWVKTFTYLDELPWVHYESVSVCLSPDKTNFNSKSFQSIFELFTYLD